MRQGSRRLVAAADATALLIGLRPGQAVAQAQASVPGLAVAEARPEEDAAALAALAGWCLRYSPVVQADPPDGILLDVTGAAHLHGGEAGFLRDVRRRLAGAGYAARIAIADTPGCARALARSREAAIVPPGGTEAALDPLPIGVLHLPEEVERALGLLGLGTIGQLLRQPRAPLARRFGRPLLDPLDRALGHAPDPLTPLLPRAAAQARLAFAEPLGHADGLVAAASALARRLCRELEARCEGARVLDSVFRRVDGQPIGLRIGTAAPTRDPAHLAKLLAARLPEIDPGFGIDEVVLVAARTEPLAERQGGTLDLAEGREIGLGPLVDRLAVRLGASRIYRAAPVESRMPERAVRRVPALSPPTRLSWPATLPRPSRLIDPPEPVAATALLPDNPPVFFVWRRIRFAVARADGPERVRGEWWRSDAEVSSLRDYYRVEDRDGRRFWLFRDAPAEDSPRWWLHGSFV